MPQIEASVTAGSQRHFTLTTSFRILLVGGLMQIRMILVSSEGHTRIVYMYQT